LQTRIVGACEAIDVQLGFNQHHLSRMVEFIPTELNPKQKFLKKKVQLAALATDSEDVYQKSKFQAYLERNSALHDITYPMYYQWWRKCNVDEQRKGEKSVKKGNKPTVGFKGEDEFDELKKSMREQNYLITELNVKLDSAVNHWINCKSMVFSAILSILQNVYCKSILEVFKSYFTKRGYGNPLCDDFSDEDITEATTILNNSGLLNDELIQRANQKLHWLHTKLLMAHSTTDIKQTSLYIMLETYPPGTMIADINGNFWARRARACVTRHRFLSLDDQEAFYEQKFLLKVPLTLSNDVVKNPPSSWIKAAMVAGLIDEQHDAKANLMDAVNRGFTFENIKSIVKLYLEHKFLDEEEADAFLSTVPIGP